MLVQMVALTRNVSDGINENTIAIFREYHSFFTQNPLAFCGLWEWMGWGMG